MVLLPVLSTDISLRKFQFSYLNITAADSSAALAATSASYQIGYLESIGLATNWISPPSICQHILEYVHVYTGMPWWQTIICVAIGLKIAMFPLIVKSSDTTMRMARIQPETHRLTQELQESGGPSNTEAVQKYLEGRNKVMADNGINMKWMMAPMANIPISLGMFFGIDAMCLHHVADLTTEGLYWFNDLSVADPYLGLQLITSSFYLLMARFGGETGIQSSGLMKKVGYALPVVSVFVTMNFPAAVVLYFASTGFLSAIQSGLLRSAKFRSFLRIAPLLPAKSIESAQSSASISSQAKIVIDTVKKVMEEQKKQSNLKK
ncbi:60Kd inner membrane protein-domain-containing protein [Dipodascopsis tothii]|uniref:60Kd inner membrane protein-domain-containing protein n=1 Tax=Dipodascopsis tothii TaxID=44089 RepID=UPI0034CD1744